MIVKYGVGELLPYINWIYFFHAWGVKGEEAVRLRQEAMDVLRQWAAEKRECLFCVRLFMANSEGEDLLLHEDATVHRIPLLRQQRSPYLCLADFLPPMGMPAERMGLFASTVPFAVEELMEQTLADRLAEACAEKGHEQVRKTFWGYAPDEDLTPQELFAERYRGKRPAVGYPSIPDQSILFRIGELLDFPSIGISLTESGAMLPHATTSGLLISHPRCRHFSVGAIGEDQLQDYAGRRGMSADSLRRFLTVQDVPTSLSDTPTEGTV